MGIIPENFRFQQLVMRCELLQWWIWQWAETIVKLDDVAESPQLMCPNSDDMVDGGPTPVSCWLWVH